MNTLPVLKDDVINDFPVVTQWLDNIKEYLKKDIDNNKLEFYYTFGFFLPKVENKDEFYMKMYEDCSKMKYNERLSFEMSKVRVSLTLKNGNFMLSDRLPKGKIPKMISDVVAEITKLKMIIECDYHGDQEISNSIPELDQSIISFENIKDYIKGDMGPIEYDLDSILDKISNQGFDSLSDEEKDFLDKKSKE